MILDVRPNIAGGIAALIILSALGFSLYFLPSIIGRKKRNFASILVLNIFLGWTFVGWIVALVWAVANDSQPQEINTIVEASKADKFDKLTKLKHLLDSNAISEDEYNKEKAKILSE